MIVKISHTISELSGEIMLQEISLSQLKRNTDILVIDDDEFIYEEPLKKNEYRIDHKVDIESLKDVAEYDIILCDVRGVGKFLKSDYEGAYLVKQIKEKYPNKLVVSYTANSYEPEFYKYLSYADRIVAKGTALEDWDSLLSSMLKDLADPVKQWEKTRNALLNANVSTIMVAKYESEFVHATKNGTYKSLKDLYNKNKKPGVEIMITLLDVVCKILLSK